MRFIEGWGRLGVVDVEGKVFEVWMGRVEGEDLEEWEMFFFCN